MRTLLALWLAVVALGAAGLAVRVGADEEPARGDAAYAGRDAAWWVRELRGAGTREAARAALRAIGEPAIPYLGPLLRHHDPLLRAAAVELLLVTKGSLARIEPDVLAWFERGEVGQARYNALGLLARIRPGNVQALPALRAALLDRDESARSRAREALAALQLPPAALLPVLAEALDSADAGVRATAYRALQPLGPAAGELRPRLEAHVRTLHDRAQLAPSISDEASQALEALARVAAGAPGVWPLVLAHAMSPHAPDAAGRALRLLATLEPHADDAVEPLFGLLEGARRSDRVALITAVGRLGSRGAPAVPWVLGQLTTGDHQVVEACAWALHRIPPTDVPRLLALLGAAQRWPNAHSLTQAIAASLIPELDLILRQDASVFRSQPYLLELLQARSQDIVVAGRAEELAAFLLPGLVGPGTPRSYDVRYEAPKLELVLAHAPRALAALVAATSSDDPLLRIAATQLLVHTRAGVDALRAALPSAPEANRPALLRALFDRARSDLAEADLGLAAEHLEGSARFVAAEVLGNTLRPLEPRLSSERQQRLLAVALERLTLPAPTEAPWALQLLQNSAATLPEAGPALAAMFLAEEDRHRALALSGAALHQGASSPVATRQVWQAAWDGEDPVRQAKAALGLLGYGTQGGDVGPVQARVPAWLGSERATVRMWGVQTWHVAEYALRESPLGQRLAHLPLVWGLIRDPDAQVRSIACNGLVFLAGDDEGTLGALRAALLDRANPHRADVAQALAMGGAACVPLLVAGLDDPELLRACLSSLGSSRLREHAQAAIPRLERLLAETSEPDLNRFVRIVLEGIPR